MISHAFAKPEFYIKYIIKGFWEKFQNSSISKTNPVNIIGPVNKQTAPYHNDENRKINPVVPSNDKRMFINNLFHVEEKRGSYFLHLTSHIHTSFFAI